MQTNDDNATNEAANETCNILAGSRDAATSPKGGNSIAVENGISDSLSTVKEEENATASQPSAIAKNALVAMPLFRYLRPTSVKVYVTLQGGLIRAKTTAAELAQASGVGQRSIHGAMNELQMHELISFTTERGEGYRWQFLECQHNVRSAAEKYQEKFRSKKDQLLRQLMETKEREMELKMMAEGLESEFEKACRKKWEEDWHKTGQEEGQEKPQVVGKIDSMSWDDWK